jgi:hypothetical protein
MRSCSSVLSIGVAPDEQERFPDITLPVSTILTT